MYGCGFVELWNKGTFSKVILLPSTELKKDGFITVFPSTGEKHTCAVLESEKIGSGLIIVNAFRESVELLPLDKRFRDIVKSENRLSTTEDNP